jgi:hypothetical protein
VTRIKHTIGAMVGFMLNALIRRAGHVLEQVRQGRRARECRRRARADRGPAVPWRKAGRLDGSCDLAARGKPTGPSGHERAPRVEVSTYLKVGTTSLGRHRWSACARLGPGAFAAGERGSGFVSCLTRQRCDHSAD